MNIEQIIADRIEECKTILASYGLEEFPITFSIEKLGRGIAGQAFYPSRIKISEDYLHSEFQNQILDRTVVHEVAHLYVRRYFPMAKQAHGPEFRRLMKIMGADAATYHNMKLEGMEKRKYTRKRYVYKNTEGDICHLTPQQHKKQQESMNKFGKSKYTKNGFDIRFTGEVKAARVAAARVE